MTYEQLYGALLAGRPVRYRRGADLFAVLKIVPTGEERHMPEFGALVQLSRPGDQPFWERGAVLAYGPPVKRTRRPVPVVPTQ